MIPGPKAEVQAAKAEVRSARAEVGAVHGHGVFREKEFTASPSSPQRRSVTRGCRRAAEGFEAR